MDLKLHHYVLFLAAVFALCCVPWVVSSYFEAQSYNRLTGANVTTWDAMWIDLRVQAEPKH